MQQVADSAETMAVRLVEMKGEKTVDSKVLMKVETMVALMETQREFLLESKWGTI